MLLFVVVVACCSFVVIDFCLSCVVCRLLLSVVVVAMFVVGCSLRVVVVCR